MSYKDPVPGFRAVPVQEGLISGLHSIAAAETLLLTSHSEVLEDMNVEGRGGQEATERNLGPRALSVQPCASASLMTLIPHRLHKDGADPLLHQGPCGHHTWLSETLVKS